MKTISLIIPSYNEEESLSMLYAGVRELMDTHTQYSWELLFINDGSNDNTASIIDNLIEQDPRVACVELSRNFGKEAGLLAGMRRALDLGATHVAVMDADLQDPPELLPQMCERMSQGGCDAVAAYRQTREGEPPVRSFFARMFYKLINTMSKTEIVDGARDFRLMRRRVVKAILSMPERNRFSKGLFGWVGFKTKWIEFENVERVAGETKWSFWKLFKYSIEGIVAFTTTPLVISSAVGFAFCVIALAATVFIFLRKLIFGDPVTGWASTVCIITFLGGIQLFFLGVIGQYLAKAYLEIKNRPLYVVGETNVK